MNTKQFNLSNISLFVQVFFILFHHIVPSVELLQFPAAGAQVRLSQTGLNYASGVAVSVLTRNIQGRPLPPQTGTDSLDVGRVRWQVRDMTITGFTRPTTRVNLLEGHPMVWSMSGGGINVAGQWRYEYKLWRLKVRDSGAFTLDVNGLSVTVKIALERNPDHKPRVRVLDCVASIEDIEVVFIGGRDWLYNLFSSSIEVLIQKELEQAVCEEAAKAIEDSGNEELVSLNLDIPLGTDMTINCHLASDPVIGNGYILTSHKARAEYAGNTSTLSVPAPPTNSYAINEVMVTKMVALYVSEYAANTIGYLFQERGKLSYLLTRNDLRAGNFLSTNCSPTVSTTSSQPPCFGTIFPAASLLFPNAVIELNMTSLEPPRLKITSDGAVGKFRGRMEVLGKLPVTPMRRLMDLDVSADMFFQVEMEGKFVKARVTRLVPTISLENSNIGVLTPGKLTELLQYAVDSFIIPKVNEVLSGGFDVPSFEGLEFVAPELFFVEGGVILSTDVSYIHA